MFETIKFEIGMLRFKLDQRRNGILPETRKKDRNKHFDALRSELKRRKSRRNLKMVRASYLENIKLIPDEEA